tara:strand:- start:44 stop:457 length:414 start_codon:yes stop_codon:yes gene_type:complete
MKTVYACKHSDNTWFYTESEASIPSGITTSFPYTFTDLSSEEEEYFSSDLLTYNEESKTITFNHSKFDSEVKNVVYIDETTTEGQLEECYTKRRNSYGSVESQLDLLYHDIKNGNLNTSGQWYVGITSVKESYPKPS